MIKKSWHSRFDRFPTMKPLSALQWDSEYGVLDIERGLVLASKYF